MPITFAKWITTQKQYKILVHITDDFLADSFNYYGLNKYVDRYKEAMNVVRGCYTERVEKDRDLLRQSILLYGLLHARYLLTYDGIDDIKDHFSKGMFPPCPRYLCKGHSTLPYGTSEIYGEDKLKLFCPGCCDVYELDHPLYSKIDGAFFGPNYVHVLKQKYRTVTPYSPIKEFPLSAVPKPLLIRLKRRLKAKQKALKNETKK